MSHSHELNTHLWSSDEPGLKQGLLPWVDSGLLEVVLHHDLRERGRGET